MASKLTNLTDTIRVRSERTSSTSWAFNGLDYAPTRSHRTVHTVELLVGDIWRRVDFLSMDQSECRFYMSVTSDLRTLRSAVKADAARFESMPC